MHILIALAGSLKAAVLVGAAVFAATLVYAIDRTGWVFGLVLGWAPALLMGLVAGLGNFILALIVQAPRSRRQIAPLPEGGDLMGPAPVPVSVSGRPLAARAL